MNPTRFGWDFLTVSIPPFHKRVRLAHLLGCKHLCDGSLSLFSCGLHAYGAICDKQEVQIWQVTLHRSKQRDPKSPWYLDVGFEVHFVAAPLPRKDETALSVQKHLLLLDFISLRLPIPFSWIRACGIWMMSCTSTSASRST